MTEDEIGQQFIDSAIRADEEEDRRDREGLSLAGYMRWMSIKDRFKIESVGSVWVARVTYNRSRYTLISALVIEYEIFLNEKTLDSDEIAHRLCQMLRVLGAPNLREPPSKVASPPRPDTVHKMNANWPLEDLKDLFAAMVEQGWIAEGAETLVTERFTNSTLNEPVGGTESFNWLGGVVRLKALLKKLNVPARDALPHFQNKEKDIALTSLTSGTKETDLPKIESVKELLSKFH